MTRQYENSDDFELAEIELARTAPHLTVDDVQWCGRFLPQENSLAANYDAVARAVAGGYYDDVRRVLEQQDGTGIDWAAARVVVAMVSILPTTPRAYVGPVITPSYGRQYVTMWADTEDAMRAVTTTLRIRWGAVGRDGQSWTTRISPEQREAALEAGALPVADGPWWEIQRER